MSLGNYTYEQLVGFLDSDDPPPAPVTRKQVREAVERAVRQTAEAHAHVMHMREQQKEAQFHTVVIKMTNELEVAQSTIQQQQASIAALRERALGGDAEAVREVIERFYAEQNVKAKVEGADDAYSGPGALIGSIGKLLLQ